VYADTARLRRAPSSTCEISIEHARAAALQGIDGARDRLDSRAVATIDDDHGDPATWYAGADAPEGRSLAARVRPHVAAIVFLGLFIVGAIVKVVGGWRFAGALEAGGGLALVFAALVTIRRILRRDVVETAGRTYDFRRHRWVWVPLFVALGGVALVRATLLISDWVVEPDRSVVTIDREAFARFGVSSLHTTDLGWLRSPAFTDIDAHPGPALVSIGHVSGALLSIEQPPGD